MALKCPPGWQLFDKPTNEQGYSTAIDDYSPMLSSVVYTDRVRHGVYEWEKAEGVHSQQGLCGRKMEFNVGSSFELTESQSVNVGALFNLPGYEALEISGGYAYEWGSADGTGSGQSISLGPDECWEYLVVPVVLKFTIYISWKRNGGTWYEWTNYLISQGRNRYGGVPPGYITSGRFYEKPLYIRNGLMICRRWCCDGKPPVD